MKDLNDYLWEQRSLWSELIEHDDGTINLFDDLARRSAPLVTRGSFRPNYCPESAFTPSRDRDCGLPPAILEEWLAHAGRWRRFLIINPRCRLAEILSWVSETHDATSWPWGWSGRIRDWVRSGFAGDRPFDDALGIDTPSRRAELVRAASEAGDGWVHDHPHEIWFVWVIDA